MTAEPLTTRGVSTCRGCTRPGLVSVLDLGYQPLANELIETPVSADPVFPLHLKCCPSCGLGQVGEYVLPAKIFSDYPYLSSMSASWLEHGQRYVEAMQTELPLDAGDLVVEIASNDGYLLRPFQAAGMDVLGIEPADNVAAIAREAGVPTLSEFFGRDCAERVVKSQGHPRLVVANNVMAHVPDLDDFVAGLALLCGEDTTVTVENPTFITLLEESQFDTIYHEHFSYLTAHSVRTAARRHGLELTRVQSLPTHGGSNRYWLTLQDVAPTHDSVDATIGHELERGLLTPRLWEEFAERSWDAITGLRNWLDQRRRDSDVVAAFGAAAKGNTLLNAAGVTPADITFVTDASPEKQGKYLPGTHLAVRPHHELSSEDPSDVLITPWNLADELVPLVQQAAPSARAWVAVPSLRRLL